jgi:hypothetical protein
MIRPDVDLRDTVSVVRQQSGDVQAWRKAYSFLSDLEHTTNSLLSQNLLDSWCGYEMDSPFHMPPAKSEYLLVGLHTLLLERPTARRAMKRKASQPILSL